MERVDLVVVGGGPAGCAAATAAARTKDVTVLEKGVPRTDRARLGPDSTDAAGMLDYWAVLSGIPETEFPRDVILREIARAEIIGPTERVVFEESGRESWYPGFAFTFDRVKFDDWFRARAEDAGAQYRTGTTVERIRTRRTGGDYRHELTLRNGDKVEADYLVLADGPHRNVTRQVLSQFVPDGRIAGLDPQAANHVAYQEYRRFPAAEFDETSMRFWWGYIPGETAYLWCFPNRENVMRVGLTRPMDLRLADVDNSATYELIRESDERFPNGPECIERLLNASFGDRYDVPSDFPRVETSGKNRGTEGYQISSTRPIESPTRAGIAVTGGAMGATSAFHEGGYHFATRTGKIAGELIAEDNLGTYNAEWRRVIGGEVTRDLAVAKLTANYGPNDWDRLFRNADLIMHLEGVRGTRKLASVGTEAIRTGLKYAATRARYKLNSPVQISESDYRI